MKINIKAKDGKARTGTIETSHGKIETPFFMTIATVGAVKGIEARNLRQLDCQVVLSNTYHLHLRPSSEIVRKAGGIHKFMAWDGPMLTDSGGFQVFSLARIRKITEEGVTFSSHIDGKKIVLTPEDSMQIQMNLGADIIMAFDECKAPDTKQRVQKSMDLTTRWAKRSLDFVKKLQKEDPTLPTKNQQLFGIVQGSTYPDLRKKSAEDLVRLGFDGYAIGGLSVGEPEDVMYSMVDAVLPYLPNDQPRYLMGVGTPINIIESVARGVDMFDCVLPTRNARHGYLYTSQGMINIRNSQYKTDFSSLDPNCECETCMFYTRSYLRHLIKAKEFMANTLLVRHNIYYYHNLMKKIRSSIYNGTFEVLRKELHSIYT